jgi:integrase
MRGHISRRGDAWRVHVFLGYDSRTGRQRYLTRTVHGTRREAENVRAELVTEAARGEHGDTAAGTVNELLEQWLEHRRRDLSPSTVAAYRLYLDNWIKPALGTKRLDRLGPVDIDKFYASMRTKVAPATVRKAHTILRAALGQGVRWRMIHSNPAAAATPPRVPKPTITPPTPAEVARLMAAAQAQDPELGLFVRLAAVTGVRRGELCALQWGDLDFENGEVLIHRAIVKGTTQLVVKRTKTGRDRRIALDETTLSALVAQRKRMNDRAARCGFAPAGDRSFVFARDVAGELPWRPDSSATGRFIKLRDELGLPRVRLHDLRHFVATRLLDAGVPVRSVGERLGHASATTTLTTYAAAVPATDRAAADIMSGLVDDMPDDRPRRPGRPRR